MRSILIIAVHAVVLTLAVLFATLSILVLLHLARHAEIREPVLLLAHILYRGLVPAAFAGCFLVLFRIVRLPVSPTLSLPFLSLMSAGLLFGAGSASLLLKDAAVHPESALSRPSAELLYHFGATSVYFGQVEGLVFEEVVVLRPQETPVLRYYSQAMHDTEENGLLLMREAESPVLLRFPGASSPLVSSPQAPEYLLPLVRDAVHARSHFVTTLGASRIAGVILSAALAVYLASCFVCVRFSRWPLFNVLLTLLVFRLTLMLYAAIAAPAFAQFVVTLVPALPEFLVVPLVFGAAAMVFLLITVPLPRYRDWKRGVGYA